jgi:CDP-glucose 4,6-dehydratase
MENNQICRSFWNSKKVLISGHTGFKGGWLTLWLKSMGADICGLSLPPQTKPSLFDYAVTSDGIRHEIIDIRNFEDVDCVFKSFRPEIVIHMAAQPLVRFSYQQPVETYAINVMGTVHILEACRRARSVEAIVNITTDKCYENREWMWGYRENEPMGGHDPYSSSKGCVELISSAYSRSFLEEEGIGMATARAGNVIGGGDWADDRLVPDLLKALERNDSLQIRNPEAIRPWQHVLEPLSGYLKLAQELYHNKSDFLGAWNFGPNDNDVKTVRWIAKELASKWGSAAEIIYQSGEHPHEAHFLKLDISKAKRELSWEPQWSLNTALDKIVCWHKSWIAGDDMRAQCIQQIDEYTAMENIK